MSKFIDIEPCLSELRARVNSPSDTRNHAEGWMSGFMAAEQLVLKHVRRGERESVTREREAARFLEYVTGGDNTVPDHGDEEGESGGGRVLGLVRGTPQRTGMEGVVASSLRELGSYAIPEDFVERTGPHVRGAEHYDRRFYENQQVIYENKSGTVEDRLSGIRSARELVKGLALEGDVPTITAHRYLPGESDVESGLHGKILDKPDYGCHFCLGSLDRGNTVSFGSEGLLTYAHYRCYAERDKS